MSKIVYINGILQNDTGEATPFYYVSSDVLVTKLWNEFKALACARSVAETAIRTDTKKSKRKRS